MKLLNHIDEPLKEWLEQQPVFFVATAPLATDGHVNCSPKGGDCFRVLDSMQAAYLDYTGSGAETAAHLRENGRIVLMFCAFKGKPNIVRLHGKAEIAMIGSPAFAEISTKFLANPGARAVVTIEITRISTSCGFSVPLMDYRAERDALNRWAESKGDDALAEYRKEKNSQSIDGLPAFRI